MFASQVPHRTFLTCSAEATQDFSSSISTDPANPPRSAAGPWMLLLLLLWVIYPSKKLKLVGQIKLFCAIFQKIYFLKVKKKSKDIP